MLMGKQAEPKTAGQWIRHVVVAFIALSYPIVLKR
jgi:hypothetical protein